MLMTLTTTARPATDLGFLLHKHPQRAQAFEVSAGTAHVFYPRADEQECTVALLLEVDPIALGERVSDRPYAASSLLAVALGSVFRTAMNGRCEQRPELAETAIPLRVHIPAVGGAQLVHRLFEPLGWQVAATPLPLDTEFEQWGDSPYVDLCLTGELRVADALSHLYVLLPVLDGSKHYWVDHTEVDKLLRAGAGWLAAHPERELISRRYLAHQSGFVRTALARLAESDEVAAQEWDTPEEDPAKPVPLARSRRQAALEVLRGTGAKRVVDLGCGSGALLRDLVRDKQFTELLGVDVSVRALQLARERLPEQVELRQSALTYRDSSLTGYDAAVLMEVIEHVDEERLPALERSVFGSARPATVVVTTPNQEYNARYETLVTGRFRHADHRFEWTRAQFAHWADSVAAQYGYAVSYLPVGEPDPVLGPPTQLAVFTRQEGR
ncbi:3' terminal RNA ribose 2'-O-methyltransferase Hen1 [Kutzneria albida]|nr:3' terminal RNA ribose 2'-O-methyltransferase Hen1 [Kutzneria albida]